jgi:hypothetical protein
VNSAVKIFRLLAQLIQDPAAQADSESEEGRRGQSAGGWFSFRTTFGRPIGASPRIRTWTGKAVAHALASRALGDICFRLAARGVRDETMGMIAKVYATKSLLETAIRAYQAQGGRSVHVDERREAARHHDAPPSGYTPIENYIGENLHEFAIATVYEGPNPVLADVGGPNAMTRDIRTRYLERFLRPARQGPLCCVRCGNRGRLLAAVARHHRWHRGGVTGAAPLDPQSLSPQPHPRPTYFDGHRPLPKGLHRGEFFIGGRGGRV